MALSKLERRKRLKMRIRKQIFGTTERPRLTVFRSNSHIYVQLINDNDGRTLLSVSSREKEISANKDIKKIDQAKLVGKMIAEKAISAGIKEVVFDRNGYLYHGRVKSLADSAREGGLKI